MPILFADEIKQWTGGEWTRYPLNSIEGVSHDTRTLVPGNLYVAIQGDQHDGHAYVQAAFERGACAAVVHHRFVYRHEGDQPLLVVDDTRAALLRMARGYRSTIRGDITAVTGSVGKTTVKEMVADVLAKRAPTARTLGNWNNDLGVPLSLLAMWRGDAFGVFEVGMNAPGEIARLCEIVRPSTGILTRVGPAHIERFGSERDIAEEKAELLRSLPPDGTAFLNRDEPWYDLFAASCPCRAITLAFEGKADYQGSLSPGQLSVRDPFGGSFVYRLPLPGRFIARNALMAVAVGMEKGVPQELIAEALRSFRPQPMRWNRDELGGVAIVNDAYNANPMSMRASIEAFGELPCAGIRWLVLGGMRELGAHESREHVSLGRDLASGDWNLITVGGRGALIAEGALSGGLAQHRIHRCASAREAAALLQQSAAEGDAVLLKGSRGERVEDVLHEWQALRDRTLWNT